MAKGTVDFWNPDKKFGKLIEPGGKKYYFNRALVTKGLQLVGEGSEVDFEPETPDPPQGPKAKTVKILTEGKKGESKPQEEKSDYQLEFMVGGIRSNLLLTVNLLHKKQATDGEVFIFVGDRSNPEASCIEVEGVTLVAQVRSTPWRYTGVNLSDFPPKVYTTITAVFEKDENGKHIKLIKSFPIPSAEAAEKSGDQTTDKDKETAVPHKLTVWSDAGKDDGKAKKYRMTLRLFDKKGKALGGTEILWECGELKGKVATDASGQASHEVKIAEPGAKVSYRAFVPGVDVSDTCDLNGPAKKVELKAETLKAMVGPKTKVDDKILRYTIKLLALNKDNKGVGNLVISWNCGDQADTVITSVSADKLGWAEHTVEVKEVGGKVTYQATVPASGLIANQLELEGPQNDTAEYTIQVQYSFRPDSSGRFRLDVFTYKDGQLTKLAFVIESPVRLYDAYGKKLVDGVQHDGDDSGLTNFLLSYTEDRNATLTIRLANKKVVFKKATLVKK